MALVRQTIEVICDDEAEYNLLFQQYTAWFDDDKNIATTVMSDEQTPLEFTFIIVLESVSGV